MADKDVLAAIRKRESERPERLVETIDQPWRETTAAEALALGLDFLVDDYRRVAELYGQAKMRGGKSAADDAKTVAAALALLAVGLRKFGARAAAPPREPVGQTAPATTHERLNALVADAVAEGRGTLREVTDLGTVQMTEDPSGSGKWSNAEPISLKVPAGPVVVALEYLKGGFPATFDEPEIGERQPDGSLLTRAADVGAFLSGAVDEPSPPGVPGVVDGGTVVTWADLRRWQQCAQEPDESFTPDLGLPEHVSHSQISTFTECALKGLMTRSETLGVLQLPQWANVGGTAVHLAIERFERVVADVRQAQFVRDQLKLGGGVKGLWEDAFRDTCGEVAKEHPHAPIETWRASKKGFEGYSWWLVEGLAMVERYVTVRLAELDAPAHEHWRRLRMIEFEDVETKTYGVRPMLEHEFVMDAAGVPFKGVIDQVWEILREHDGMQPGDLLIDDLKSGSTAPDLEQLEEYALWLREQIEPHRRIWGRFIDVRNNEIVSAPVHDLMLESGPIMERLEFQVTDVAGIKASGSFAPRKNVFCGACPVKHGCPIWATRSAS